MFSKCVLLLFLCLVATESVIGKIRNGYTTAMASAQECLRQLNQRLLINPDMPESERRRIYAAMKKHTEAIAHYQLTDALLDQFRMISPDLYYRIDQLMDRRGRETDIYVRFIPEADATVMLSGVSFFRPSAIDEDASRSRFGEFTVAIDIWICDTALNLLAHEFGHTMHIVPNLAAYRRYYSETYRDRVTVSHIGHSASDASGRMAYSFGQQFLRDRRAFRLRTGKQPQRIFAILKKVRNGLREAIESSFQESLASSKSLE